MYDYRHGGNAVFENNNHKILDLSSSINPLGFPKTVEEAVVRAISRCNRYPDNESRELRQTLAEYEQVNAGSIFCAGGASDIIFRLPLSLKPKTVLLTSPTFLDYERAALSCGAKVTYHTLREESGFSLDESIIKTVKTEKPDLLFLCNPNNPTGVLTEYGLIEKLLKACKEANTFVAIDECFMDFVYSHSDYTAKPLLPKYRNLIIIKAFTKVFALTGLRLGYALCENADILDGLRFHGADWTVSNLAQEAGIAALQNHGEYLERTREFVREQRRYLTGQLQALGYKTYDSQANYVFFKSPVITGLRESLDKKGIRIRSCANFHGLSDSYYRVGVSSAENNQSFINAVASLSKHEV